MIRHSNSRSIAAYLFSLVFLASVHELRALGQSAANPTTLQVLSAEYIPGKTSDLLREPDLPRTNTSAEFDMIRVKVVNNGPRPATAYVIDVTVTSAGNAVASFQHSVDMLNQVLNERCTTGADNSWEGAIKPGDVYTESIAENLDKARITDPAKVVVHVAVSGIIWSDGSVDAESASSRAAMKRYQICCLPSPFFCILVPRLICRVLRRSRSRASRGRNAREERASGRFWARPSFRRRTRGARSS